MAIETYQGTVKIPNNNNRPDCSANHSGGKVTDPKLMDKKIAKKSNSSPSYLRKELYEG